MMRVTNEGIARQILGSKVKRMVLAFLLKQQGNVSERELSRIIGVSHTAVNKAMKQLLEANVVKGCSIGAAMAWEVNTRSLAYPLVYSMVNPAASSPLEYVKSTLTNHLVGFNLGIEEMRMKRKVVAPLISKAYIIGSVAEGTSGPDSDIDVLVLLEYDFGNDTLRNLLGTTLGISIAEKTGNEVSFHIYSEQALKRNEPHWLRKAVENGIRVI